MTVVSLLGTHDRVFTYVDKNSKLLLPVIDEKFADINILLLQLLQPNVRDFNKYLAATLVSEGIMDYEYACGRSENQYPE